MSNINVLGPEWKQDQSICCSNGFGVKIFVRRPPEVIARIEALSNERLPDNSLTPKEKAEVLLLHVVSASAGKAA